MTRTKTDKSFVPKRLQPMRGVDVTTAGRYLAVIQVGFADAIVSLVDVYWYEKGEYKALVYRLPGERDENTVKSSGYTFYKLPKER